MFALNFTIDKYALETHFPIIQVIKTINDYVLGNIRKNLRAFKIGMFSIFIVVMFLVCLQSVIQLIPIILLKMAEDQEGQVDIQLSPRLGATSTGYASELPIQFVNITEARLKLEGSPDIAAIYPRWIFPINVSTLTADSQAYKAIGIMLDSSSERKQGVGSRLEVKDLNEGECWVTRSLADMLQPENETVVVQVDVNSAISDLQSIAQAQSNTNQDLAESIVASLVNQFVQNYSVSFSDLGLGDQVDQIASDVFQARAVLDQVTNEDGSINVGLFLSSYFNIELPSAILLPLQLIQVVPASVIGDLLDQVQTAVLQLSFSVNTTQLIDFFAPIFREALYITKECKIIDIVDDPQGKWASNYGNAVVLDSKYIVPNIVKNFFTIARAVPLATDPSILSQDYVINYVASLTIGNDTVMNQTIEDSQNFDTNQYALQGNIILKNRPSLYKTADTMQADLTQVSNRMFERLTLDFIATISAPLAEIIDDINIFVNFLNTTFTASYCLLIFLSALLSYSLMSSNVEAKTFEFGVLRILGFKKPGLFFMLTLHTVYITVPSLALGILFAYILNIMICYYMFDFTLMKTSYAFGDGFPIVLGVVFGFTIPFVTSLLPVRNALSKTLRNALDPNQRSFNGVSVIFMKTSRIGISPVQIVGASLFIAFGMVVSYAAPYAYVFLKMALFFNILIAMLILALGGLTLLASLLQFCFQKCVLYILMLFTLKDRLLLPVVLTNFNAHRHKNKKTSLVFILTLAFLVFVSTSFNVVSTMMINQLRQTLGSDLVVTSIFSETTFLNEADIRDTIENFEEKYPGTIKEYAFVSPSLDTYDQNIPNSVSSIALHKLTSVKLSSVDQNFLESVYNEFYAPTSYDPKIKFQKPSGLPHPDGVQSLYDNSGLVATTSYDPSGIISLQNTTSYNLSALLGQEEIRLIIPKNLADSIPVKAGQSVLLQIGPITFRAKIRNIAARFPGFDFSGYVASGENALITSHEDYQTILNTLWSNTDYYSTNTELIQGYLNSIPPGSSYTIPKTGLDIRLHNGVKESVRLKLVNEVQSTIKGKFTFLIDVFGLVEVLYSAMSFLNLIFIMVSIIALVLCSFYTLITFIGNIEENLWEFGILRAIGLTKSNMNKIYLLEALSIIISAIILGIAVGSTATIIDLTLFSYLLELPVKFEFPITLLVITIVLSLAIAIVSSRIAVNQVKHKQISTILKSTD